MLFTGLILRGQVLAKRAGRPFAAARSSRERAYGASSPAPANGRTCNCTTDLRWRKGPLACDAHVLNSTLLRSLAGKP